MVVDGHHRVGIFLYQSPDKIVGTLLHFRVSALHGIEFYAIAIAASVNRRHAAAAQTYTVIVAAYDDNLVALLRFLLQAIAFFAIAYTTGEHNYLVIAVYFACWFVVHGGAVLQFCRIARCGFIFKGEQRTGDKGLSELVTEVGCTVRGLNQNFLRTLI